MKLSQEPSGTESTVAIGDVLSRTSALSFDEGDAHESNEETPPASKVNGCIRNHDQVRLLAAAIVET